MVLHLIMLSHQEAQSWLHLTVISHQGSYWWRQICSFRLSIRFLIWQHFWKWPRFLDISRYLERSLWIAVNIPKRYHSHIPLLWLFCVFRWTISAPVSDQDDKVLFPLYQDFFLAGRVPKHYWHLKCSLGSGMCHFLPQWHHWLSTFRLHGPTWGWGRLSYIDVNTWCDYVMT